MNRSIVLVASLLLGGCTGVQRYGVPRTLAPGDVAHHVSVDVGSFTPAIAVGCDGNGCDRGGTSMAPVPSWTLRAGIDEGVELGFGLALDLSLGLDVKVELLRSRSFDLAIAPGLTFWGHAGYDVSNQPGPAVAVMLPLLAGINLGDVTLVPGGGVGLVAGGTETGRVTWAGSFAAWFRLGDGVALAPGVTLFGAPPDEAAPRLVGGLGLVLGDLPSYGENTPAPP
ncbi:hypothetical protein [Vulgatibacter sp.]|uniref:hypothetical protein n=1 Tax=Vulgatibacter sp. TaxID=1971226 RepID=UPI003561A359